MVALRFYLAVANVENRQRLDIEAPLTFFCVHPKYLRAVFTDAEIVLGWIATHKVSRLA